jgi:hypothetical protein
VVGELSIEQATIAPWKSKLDVNLMRMLAKIFFLSRIGDNVRLERIY